MSGGCRLSGVDVADDDDVDMSLFLTHDVGLIFRELEVEKK